MGFAQTDSSVDQQRVERGASRFVGDGVSGRTGQTVAVPFDVIVKRVVGIQLALHMDLFQARDHKRIPNPLDSANFHRHGYLRILNGGTVGRRNLQRLGFAVAVGVFHNNGIHQLGIFAQFFGNGRF